MWFPGPGSKGYRLNVIGRCLQKHFGSVASFAVHWLMQRAKEMPGQYLGQSHNRRHNDEVSQRQNTCESNAVLYRSY